MNQAFAKFLENRPGRYLFAVSGGIDSMVLVDLGCRAARGRIVVAHYDHRTRANSGEDLEFVRSYCRSHSLPFVSESREGRCERLSEDRLRRVRRDFLERARKQHNCDYIVTAHHLDDNWETLLMRLVRGTGLVGVSGMRRTNGAWLKPLLLVSRNEITQYARARRLSYVEDPTNHDAGYQRNRIRQTLIPLLRQLGVSDDLRTAKGLFQDLRWAALLLKREVKSASKTVVLRTDFFVKVDTRELLGLNHTVRGSLIQRELQRITATEIRRKDVARAVFAIRRGRAVSLPGKIELTYSMGWAYLVGQKHREANILLAERLRHAGLLLAFAGARLPSGKKLSDWLYERGIPLPERQLVPVQVDERTGCIISVRAPITTLSYFLKNSIGLKKLWEPPKHPPESLGRITH